MDTQYTCTCPTTEYVWTIGFIDWNSKAKTWEPLQSRNDGRYDGEVKMCGAERSTFHQIQKHLSTVNCCSGLFLSIGSQYLKLRNDICCILRESNQWALTLHFVSVNLLTLNAHSFPCQVGCCQLSSSSTARVATGLFGTRVVCQVSWALNWIKLRIKMCGPSWCWYHVFRSTVFFIFAYQISKCTVLATFDLPMSFMSVVNMICCHLKCCPAFVNCSRFPGHCWLRWSEVDLQWTGAAVCGGCSVGREILVSQWQFDCAY